MDRDETQSSRLFEERGYGEEQEEEERVLEGREERRFCFCLPTTSRQSLKEKCRRGLAL